MSLVPEQQVRAEPSDESRAWQSLTNPEYALKKSNQTDREDDRHQLVSTGLEDTVENASEEPDLNKASAEHEQTLAVRTGESDSAYCGWKEMLHRAVCGGVRSLAALYDRQLRYRVAALKLGVQGNTGDLETELQLHAAQTATLLSAALGLQDCLSALTEASERVQDCLCELYPESSAVEPARGMKHVVQLVQSAAAAPVPGLQLMVEALQLHCDATLPAIHLSLKQLRRHQEDHLLQVECEGEDDQFPTVSEKERLLQGQRVSAQQQCGHLWDNLRVKLHRLVEMMRQNILASSRRAMERAGERQRKQL